MQLILIIVLFGIFVYRKSSQLLHCQSVFSPTMLLRDIGNLLDGTISRLYALKSMCTNKLNEKYLPYASFVHID